MHANYNIYMGKMGSPATFLVLFLLPSIKGFGPYRPKQVSNLLIIFAWLDVWSVNKDQLCTSKKTIKADAQWFCSLQQFWVLSISNLCWEIYIDVYILFLSTSIICMCIYIWFIYFIKKSESLFTPQIW